MRRGRILIYVFLFFLATINYVDRVALSVSAGSIAKEFGIDTVALGYLFSSFLWLYVVCLVPMGMIVDRFGTRAVNAGGMALWSAATVVTGLAGGFGSLIASRIAMGVGEATTYPAGGRVIREWVPLKERALATSIFNSGAYFGPAVGGLVLAWLVEAAGWRMAFYVCGAVGFVWLAAWLVYYHLPEQAKWLDEDERRMIVAERDMAPKTAAKDATSMGVLKLLSQPSMLGLMLAQGCAVYTQYLFLTWLPNYLQTERGLTMLKSGFLMALPYLGAVVLTMLLGKLSDSLLTTETARDGRRRIVIAVILLLSSVILLTPLIANVYVILFLIMIALTGVSGAVALNIALLNDLLRSPADIGRATGLLILGGNIFGLLAPVVTGYVIKASGSFNYAFVIAGLLLLLGALAALFLTRRAIGPEPRLAVRPAASF
jgi:ACS family glucarate transporter-like MFS transporter